MISVTDNQASECFYCAWSLIPFVKRRRMHTKRVLIVGDDDQLSKTIQETLSKVGFDTYTTWSGHEALALLQSHTFVALLADDYLADLHSADFLKRAARLAPQTKIILAQAPPFTARREKKYLAIVRKGDVEAIRKAVESCHLA